MKILFEHSGVLPVLKYGGTERILFWLMKELIRLGHEVMLIGHPDSQVKEHGITLIKRQPDQDDWRDLIPRDVDLIHLFYTPSFEFNCPVIVTIEGNGRVGESFHPNTVFVSKKHAQNHGSDVYIYNGLDLSEYPYQERKRERFAHFMFLAKGSWKVKNLKDCIKACKANKKHLHIGGGRSWWPSRFIHSYGMIDTPQKLDLFLKVDALLWPVRWHEPFGIAIIEAMACGVPVIGSCYGSLPELITPQTGILCQNYKQFEEVLGQENSPFDPREIRQYVEKNFSIELMTENYLKLYERVKNGETLNQVAPQTQSQKDPEFLLPF